MSTSQPTPRMQAAWAWCEDRLDLASPRLNPLRHLGSLALLMFWVLIASGIYLYAMIDTSVDDAHASIDRLSREQWYFGGVLRSLHRYAADVLVLTTALHLLREWSFGRFRRFRAASWWTGVALLPLITVSAIGGFWLNWDQLGQYSAIATAEWLDWWPLFASPFTRNFLGVASISDRLFSLFVFVHIGVPLLMVFGIWFHLRRLAHAAVWPPRPMLWTMLALLLVLALRGAGAEPCAGRSRPRARGPGLRLDLVVRASAGDCDLDDDGVAGHARLARVAAASAVLARHAGCGPGGGRSRSRPLQWLPALRGRLSV